MPVVRPLGLHVLGFSNSQRLTDNIDGDLDGFIGLLELAQLDRLELSIDQLFHAIVLKLPAY